MANCLHWILIVGMLSSGCLLFPGGVEIPVKELASGSGPRVDFETFVVRETTDLASTWTSLTGRSGNPPAVNFSVSIVVGVALGKSAQGCEQVRITSAREASHVLTVHVSNYTNESATFCAFSNQPYTVAEVASRLERVEFRYETRPLNELPR